MPPQGENKEAKIEGVASGEFKPVETAEVGPISKEKAPLGAEKPAGETFADQPTASAPSIPNIQNDQQDDSATPPLDVSDDYDDKVPPIDESWVDAVENVIQKDKGEPYEEERDAEKLSVKYLWQRFKKKIKIDKE